MIVRTDRIGDVILTLPMAQVLKKHFPAVHISMFIRRYTAEIVQYHTDVDQMLFYDNDDQSLPFVQLVRMLRAEHIDVVFQTNPRFRIALLMWLAGIPIRVGTGYRWYSFLFNRKVFEHRKDARYHELEYNLHLLKAIDCPVNFNEVTPSLDVTTSASENIRSLLLRQGISPETKIVILHPGSGGSAREWSAKKFGELGKQLAGLQGVKIVVTGGKGEETLVQSVMETIQVNCCSFVGMLTLSELAALAKISSLFIANSTGPIHIAAAVGTYVIGLYSQLVPMSATRWGPYTGKKTIFSPHHVSINCGQCTDEEHAVCACMETITVNEVFNAAVAVLAKPKDEVQIPAVHLSKSK